VIVASKGSKKNELTLVTLKENQQLPQSLTSYGFLPFLPPETDSLVIGLLSAAVGASLVFDGIAPERVFTLASDSARIHASARRKSTCTVPHCGIRAGEDAREACALKELQQLPW
jgi:hypothetical protein